MIRPAELEDVPRLIALFKEHHASMGCSWTVDVAQLTRTLTHAVSSPEWLCLTGHGCLFLAVSFESPLGAGRLAQELCFCAPPRRMAELIDRYEQWARSKGCRAASLACEQRFATFERLYRRYGYRSAELTTQKEL
ncbi:hypothetical protein [Bradyrhizobium daqingense]|uniref:hypothetical protein n=1 Tax=Bradyrhizobium daqingense TaxID=993502 RepID=UPI003833A57F